MKTFLEYLQTTAEPSFPGALVLPDVSGVMTSSRLAGNPPQIKPDLPISGTEPVPSNFSTTDLRDPRVIDDINNHLEVKLAERFLTPYIALERARKVLSLYGIVIPAVAWMNGDDGEKVFPIFQWGGIYGTKGITSLDTNLESNPNYVVYISWSYVEHVGVYDIYAAVVNTEQLNTLLKTDFDGTPFDDQDEKEDSMSV